MKLTPIFFIGLVLLLVLTSACNKQEADLTGDMTDDLTVNEKEVINSTTNDIIDENEELDIGDII